MRNPIEKYLGPEDHLHIQICKYVLFTYQGCRIHHSPNEGKRTWVQQYRIKHLGVSPGFVDLLLFYKGKIIAPELKVGKNKATKNQQDWIALLNFYKIPSKVCTGFDDTKNFI